MEQQFSEFPKPDNLAKYIFQQMFNFLSIGTIAFLGSMILISKRKSIQLNSLIFVANFSKDSHSSVFI